MRTPYRFAFVVLVLTLAGPARAAEYPKPKDGDYILKDFKFQTGETLPEVRMHFRTVGEPTRNAAGKVTNAVLILHGTTGKGDGFISDIFAGELFGKDQPLDARKYFVVIPDNLGHGQSTRPSDGLHAKFPRYGYHDMIHAQHRLLTEGLKVDHLRLVMGTSMGGMHTWYWGQLHPDFMDALLPLASLPTEISGRNRVWRKIISDAIRNDPTWKNGDYEQQPPSLRTALEVLYFMGNNPIQRFKDAPTLKEADAKLEEYLKKLSQTSDANNVLYAVEASWDYHPHKGLEKIKAPLLAINFADDLINPPELGILEREIKRVPNGRAIMIPYTDQTRGHGTHTMAAIWKHHLVELLKASER